MPRTDAGAKVTTATGREILASKGNQKRELYVMRDNR